MILRILIPFALILPAMSCEPGPSQKKESKRADSIYVWMKKWKSDVHGCGHSRNYELATKMMNGFSSGMKNADSLRFYLGKPDKENLNADFLILGYYCNSICVDHMPSDSTDKEWVDFIFDARTKKLADYSHAIQ
jgi:hypothetical protein